MAEIFQKYQMKRKGHDHHLYIYGKLQLYLLQEIMSMAEIRSGTLPKFLKHRLTRPRIYIYLQISALYYSCAMNYG